MWRKPVFQTPEVQPTPRLAMVMSGSVLVGNTRSITPAAMTVTPSSLGSPARSQTGSPASPALRTRQQALPALFTPVPTGPVPVPPLQLSSFPLQKYEDMQERIRTGVLFDDEKGFLSYDDPERLKLLEELDDYVNQYNADIKQHNEKATKRYDYELKHPLEDPFSVKYVLPTIPWKWDDDDDDEEDSRHPFAVQLVGLGEDPPREDTLRRSKRSRNQPAPFDPSPEQSQSSKRSRTAPPPLGDPVPGYVKPFPEGMQPPDELPEGMQPPDEPLPEGMQPPDELLEGMKPPVPTREDMTPPPMEKPGTDDFWDVVPVPLDLGDQV